jgi:hypothetical protein
MIQKLLWVVLVINVVYVVMGVAKYGSQHVDVYGIWMLKAQAWATGNGVLQNVLKNENYAYSHQQYPLLLPAMMVGWAKVFGGVESFVWIYPLLYVGVLAVLYQLTKSLAWTVAASFIGPLMAQGGRLHAGLADIWITLLVGLGLLMVRKKKLIWLSLMVMIASQIKMEGIFLMALFVGADVPWKRKWGWMAMAVMPFLWWQWQVRQLGLPSDVGFYWPGVVELVRRFGVIMVLIVKEMLNWRNWYLIWIIWWLMPKRTMEIRVLGLMSLGYLLVYLFSRIDPVVYVASSVDRIMLQLLPLWWVELSRPNLEWQPQVYRQAWS